MRVFKTKQMGEQQKQSQGTGSRNCGQTSITTPEACRTDKQEDFGSKPWDLENIRDERISRLKVQFSEDSYNSTSCRRRRLFGARTVETSEDGYNNTSSSRRGSIGARTDGTSEDNDGPVTDPFLDPVDENVPDDRSSLASPVGSEFNTVKIVTPSGTFAEAVANPTPPPPPAENQSSKGRRGKTETRYRGLHPFVPGRVIHNYPRGVRRSHFKQYVFSQTQPELTTTHQYLCETSDLEKPVYYYHDIGGYTRLDRNHRFTLHWGHDVECPVLGAMWHSSSGMHFAVGAPTMNYADRENEAITAIQRQHCDFLKPLSVPSWWHMDFMFGGGKDEGPLRHYRWKLEHVDWPQFRYAKLELREKVDRAMVKGKVTKKGKLFAVCRNIDDLNTNLWVRYAQEDFDNAVTQVKWMTWVLLTWGAMRDRMRGPHNTGSSFHNVGYTKTKRVVELPGDGSGGCTVPPRFEEIKERSLNPEEY